MTNTAAAYVVGAYEHPTRHAPDHSAAQLHAEVAVGALADAGLTRADVDGYFCGGDAPGLGPLSMVDYMNLDVRHVDSTETGGSSYLIHVAHAAEAIAAGKCNVALITLAGRPRSDGAATGTSTPPGTAAQPDRQWEVPFGPTIVNMYAMCAMRHMHHRHARAGGVVCRRSAPRAGADEAQPEPHRRSRVARVARSRS